MKEKTFPFGKYKGMPIEAAFEDKEYINWLVNQAWFLEKYQHIHTLIINNFQEPADTPEHNRLQGLFLDKDFVEQFLHSYFRSYTRIRRKNQYDTFYKPMFTSITIKKIRFEECGYDVVIHCGFECDSTNDFYTLEEEIKPHNGLKIEIKTSVGDDYPSILRKAHAMSINVLFLEEYSGKGITKESFIRMFELQGISVLFVNDI